MSISQELLDLYAVSLDSESKLIILSNIFDHCVADLPELRQWIDKFICVVKERKEREAA